MKKIDLNDVLNQKSNNPVAGIALPIRKIIYTILKKMLHLFGYSVPILYKHYSDLCYTDGVSFLDFGIDPDFKNCVDGLILVDVSKIKDEKKTEIPKTKDNRRIVSYRLVSKF
jgi:hypothetical protein